MSHLKYDDSFPIVCPVRQTHSQKGEPQVTHRDLDTLTERLRKAREAKATKVTKPRKNRRPRNVRPSVKREMMTNIRLCREAQERANLELDAVILQAYKAGIHLTAIQEALGVRSVGSVHQRIARILRDLKTTK